MTLASPTPLVCCGIHMYKSLENYTISSPPLWYPQVSLTNTKCIYPTSFVVLKSLPQSNTIPLLLLWYPQVSHASLCYTPHMHKAFVQHAD